MEDLLQDIGLTPSESKVYLTLLRLKGITTTELIGESKVSRTKVYEALTKLQKKGLVSSHILNGTKQFTALSPERLVDIIKEQEDRLIEKRELLEKKLPELIRQEDTSAEEIRIYEGFKGMKSFISDMKKQLLPHSILRGIAFDRPGVNVSIKRMFHELQKERAKEGGKTLILCNDVNQLPNKKRTYTYQKYYKFRVLDSPLPVGTQIFGDTVALFFWNKPKVVAIVSKENAQHYKAFFDSLWNQAG